MSKWPGDKVFFWLGGQVNTRRVSGDFILGDSGLYFFLFWTGILTRDFKNFKLYLREKEKKPDVRAYLYFKINIQLIINIQFFKMYQILRTGKETVCIVQYTTSKVMAIIGEKTHHAGHQGVITDNTVNTKTAK